MEAVALLSTFARLNASFALFIGVIFDLDHSLRLDDLFFLLNNNSVCSFRLDDLLFLGDGRGFLDNFLATPASAKSESNVI